jgi:ubiquinone/menaquinone biosynthesis C-methylase UbiE
MAFLRKPNMEPLPVAMSGVRMGERALQIGIGDPSLAGAIAAKVGLSGHAAVAVDNDRAAERARAAAATAGVLVDVQVTPLDSLPFTGDSFDAIILHAGADGLPPLEGSPGVAMLRESQRVLRAGGRIVILERGPRRGVGAWFRSRQPPPHPGAAADALGAAGFRAARPLAEREGYRFTEGLK